MTNPITWLSLHRIRMLVEDSRFRELLERMVSSGPTPRLSASEHHELYDTITKISALVSPIPPPEADPLPRYPLTCELGELIRELAEAMPDVESGDEEADDVEDFWRDVLQKHAESAVRLDRKLRGA